MYADGHDSKLKTQNPKPKTQNSKLSSPRALFPFAALVWLLRDRYVLLGRYYRAWTRKFHRGRQNRAREPGMGALPVFQEGGSGRKHESGRPGRFPSRERPLTLQIVYTNLLRICQRCRLI